MQITKNIKRLGCLSAILASSSLAPLGCADVGDDDESSYASSALEGDPQFAAQVAGSVQTIPDPKGVYIAGVSADGPGCKAGSWTASIAPDGEVFTIVFSEYQLEMTPRTNAIMTTNCTVSVDLRSPKGVSYAVTKFSYSGYAYLEKGVKAEQLANYRYAGLPPLRVTSNRQALVGPFDDSFLFSDDVATKGVELDWSPCDTTRKLELRTRLSMTNARPARSGTIVLSAIDGEHKIVFHLKSRRCQS